MAASARVAGVGVRIGRKLQDGSRFLLVGLAGIGVNQLLLWAFASGLSINYLLAAVLASQGSTLFNFIGVECWVFRSDGARSGKGVVMRFIAFDALNSLSLVLRIPMLYVLVSFVGMHYLIGNLIAIAITTVARFVVADSVIWSNRTEKRGVSR
jgi:dolichol-phosphate mannosyltransferase